MEDYLKTVQTIAILRSIRVQATHDGDGDIAELTRQEIIKLFKSLSND